MAFVLVLPDPNEGAKTHSYEIDRGATEDDDSKEEDGLRSCRTVAKIEDAELSC